MACQPKETPTVKPNENQTPKIPSEVITKAEEKMQSFDGYRWKIHGEQLDPKQEKRLYQFDIDMNYHDEGTYHAKRTLKDQQLTSTHYEIYAQKPYIYSLMSETGNWIKLHPATSFEYDAQLSFDRKWSIHYFKKNKTK